MRVGTIVAYRRALYYCIAPALGLAYIPLIAAFCQDNYFLGKTQNAVTNVGNDGKPVTEDGNGVRNQSSKNKENFLNFWAGK